MRIVAGAKRPLAVADERAAVVVTDGAGSGRSQGVDDLLSVVHGDERHDLVQRIGGSGGKRPHLRQTQRGGDRLRHSQLRRVGVGVGDVERDVVADEVVNDPALGALGGHGLHRPQEQRMVHDQQIGMLLDGLVDHVLDRIDGKQDPAYVVSRVADDEPDRIAVFRPPCRIEELHPGNRLGERRMRRHLHQRICPSGPHGAGGKRIR